MRLHSRFLATLFAAGGTLAAAQTATITLSSPQDGQVLQEGATVEWEIHATVPVGDGFGLGLVLTDLVQDLGNPGTVDLQSADGVPGDFANFNRPAGVSNLADDGTSSGYGGLLRGDIGAYDLLEIGGGQNTFGQALPAGSGIAESSSVTIGVGLGYSALVAQGSFVVGSVPGQYTFRLARRRANVITTVSGDVYFVTSATIDGTDSITFAVGDACPADLNDDGVIDVTDLAIVLANFGQSGGALGDIDGDGSVNLNDLAIILSDFGSTC